MRRWCAFRTEWCALCRPPRCPGGTIHSTATRAMPPARAPGCFCVVRSPLMVKRAAPGWLAGSAVNSIQVHGPVPWRSSRCTAPTGCPRAAMRRLTVARRLPRVFVNMAKRCDHGCNHYRTGRSSRAAWLLPVLTAKRSASGLATLPASDASQEATAPCPCQSAPASRPPRSVPGDGAKVGRTFGWLQRPLQFAGGDTGHDG